jgi:hypothetical protein
MSNSDNTNAPDAVRLAKLLAKQKREQQQIAVWRAHQEAHAWDEMNTQVYGFIKRHLLAEGKWDDIIGKPTSTRDHERRSAKEKVVSYIRQRGDQEWKNSPPTLAAMTRAAMQQYKGQLLMKNGQPYTENTIKSWIRSLKLHNPHRGRRKNQSRVNKTSV